MEKFTWVSCKAVTPIRTPSLRMDTAEPDHVQELHILRVDIQVPTYKQGKRLA